MVTGVKQLAISIDAWELELELQFIAEFDWMNVDDAWHNCPDDIPTPKALLLHKFDESVLECIGDMKYGSAQINPAAPNSIVEKDRTRGG